MSIGLVALSLGTHHVPSPGPAELGTTAAIVAMVIGITLTAVHSVQKTPRRAIGQAGLAFVLGACAGIAIADGINALVVWGDDTTTAIGYTMATAAGVVGAVATYLVGRRAGILGSATAPRAAKLDRYRGLPMIRSHATWLVGRAGLTGK